MVWQTRSAAWVIGLACCAAAVAVPGDSARADELRVVASIKPIHSLVAGVTDGVVEPTLLLKGSASPHSYALTPSDAAALESADVIFWIGEGFEVFLAKPLKSLPRDARVVELGQTRSLRLLPLRTGGLWEPHVDEDAHEHVMDTGAGDHFEEGLAHAGDETTDEHGEHHKAYDGHLWLDPGNAILLVERIAAELIELDPSRAAAYRDNARTLTTRIEALDAEIAAALAPVKDVPFVVFHDAYHYLENRYGLTSVGSITISPEQPPGARRLNEIRTKIITNGVACVFREPNFEPALVETVIDGTPARMGLLDSEGAALQEGPQLYFELMRGNAESLKSCLAASS